MKKMNIMNIKAELYKIQDILGQGKIDLALNQLLKLSRENPSLKEIANYIIIFQSTNSHIFNDEVILGNYNPIEKSKLVRGILEIIDKIEKEVVNKKQTDHDLRLKQYLKTVVYDFQKWQNRFVHIEGRERVDEIQVYAQEIIKDEDFEDENEGLNVEVRFGKITELRNSIVEKQMIIIGDAGMGKSTTLQFIAYKDASLLLSKNIDNILENEGLIPIYLELKLFTDFDSIIEKICTKTNIEKTIIENLLEKGKMLLLIDGLNEIDKSIKGKIYNQIKNTIYNYPETKLIITSRPNSYHREFDNNLSNITIPVFQLKKMNDEQINEFVIKNGASVKHLIENEISNKTNLYKLMTNPLLLYMLIVVVSKDKKIPENKSKIIRLFIFNLYLRERQEKDISFDIDSIHLLLSYLGYHTRKITGSNVGLNKENQVLPLLEKRKKEIGLDINLLYLLEKAMELHLLVNDSGQISFAHEIYQEFYAAEYLKSITII